MMRAVQRGAVAGALDGLPARAPRGVAQDAGDGVLPGRAGHAIARSGAVPR